MNSKLLGAMFALLLGMQVRTWGQGTYHLSVRKDVPVLSAAAALVIGGTVAGHFLPALTDGQRAQLDAQLVPSFDRFNVGDWRPRVAMVSDVAVLAICASPLALFAGKSERHDARNILVLGAEAGLITLGLTNAVKVAVHRTRPFVYGNAAPLDKLRDKDARLSFFSGHTSLSATATFFAAQVFADYHPASKWKPLVWAGAAIVPAGVAYLRIRAGKHFLSDVVTGYAVGAASGILVPLLHRSKTRHNLSVQPMFWGNGSGLAMQLRW